MLVSLNCSLVNAASLVLGSREEEHSQRPSSLSGLVLVLTDSRHEQNQTSACHLASSFAWSGFLRHWTGSSLCFFSEACAGAFSFPPQGLLHYTVFLIVLFNSCLSVVAFESPLSPLCLPQGKFIGHLLWDSKRVASASLAGV